MQFRFLILILFIGLCRGNTSLGKLELRPSFSHLTFTSSLATNPSNLVVDGTKLFILARDCKSNPLH